jgi:hypothetical protein
MRNFKREIVMKKIFLYLFLNILLLVNVFASDNTAGCLQKISTLSGPVEILNKELTSCGYNKGLAELEKVKVDQEKYVLEKLASKLALQIDQNSEETALLTNYFNSNGDDLLMKEADPKGMVKRECSLIQMKEIEKCGGAKKGPLYDMKLGLLKNKLNPINKKSKYGDDLFGILADKYTNNLGISGITNKENNLQCPLDGGASGFSLTSQLDNISAEQIIKIIQENKDPQVLKELFDRYAQLKFIRDSGKIEELKKFLTEFNPNKKRPSAKEYIGQFFKDKNNQRNFFVPAMASECSKISKNINLFLCEDLTELGSTNRDNSKMMFNGLDVKPMDDQLIDFDSDAIALRAYGFQCIALAKSKVGKNDQKLDDWYNDFSHNTRPEVSNDKNIEKNKLFCANYSCASNEVKGAPSCKAGGPLFSSDLKKMMECDLSPLGKKCDSDSLKAIDYMASIEKLKSSIGMIFDGNDSSTHSPEEIKKAKSSLPDFAENFLGIEGSLVALGLPVTPTLIAEKTEDFKERKLNSEIPPYQPPTSNHTEYAQNDKVDPGHDSAPNIPYFPSEPIPAPIIPSSSQTSSSYKKIEGIHGKAKNEVSDDLNNPFGNKRETVEVQKKITETPQAESTATNSFIPNEQKNYSSIERELENKLKSGERSLEERRQLADLRDANYWARVQDLERKENEFRESRRKNENTEEKNTPKNSSGDAGSSLRKEDAKKTIDKLKREIASDVSASSAGIIVTPEKLDKLEKKDLKNYGVDVEEPFIISIRMKGKLIHVRVAKVKMNNKTFLAPSLDEDNKEVTEVILKSPIFKEFRYYYDKKNASYFPVK